MTAFEIDATFDRIDASMDRIDASMDRIDATLDRIQAKLTVLLWMAGAHLAISIAGFGIVLCQLHTLSTKLP
jgi:hypothetical protein